MDYKEKVIALLNDQELSKEQKEKLENIFPELKENESEDERIKKAIIRILKGEMRYVSKEDADRYITWLEKQGNPNTFEVSETSIKDAEEVTSRMQYIEDDMKPIAEFIINYANWNLHKDEWNQPTLTVPLFRVLDALIQRGKPYGECVQSIEEQGEKKPVDEVKPKFKVGDTITDPTDSTFTFHINAIKDGKYMESDIDWVLINKADSDYELVEQKPAWTKWDEERYLSCLKKLSTGNIEQPETVNTVWFKSLKDRVFPQPQQKWSEKDKGNLLDVKCIVDEVWHNQDVREVIGYSVVDLKSLWHWLDNIWQRVEYPNDTWKPSDSQIECLSDAIKHYNSQGYTAPVLKELLEQLKKLREE